MEQIPPLMHYNVHSIILGQKTISPKGNSDKNRDGTMLNHTAMKKTLKRRISSTSSHAPITVIRC